MVRLISNLWICAVLWIPVAASAAWLMRGGEVIECPEPVPASLISKGWKLAEPVTNIVPEEVITNYPLNYAERLALVPMYQAAASNLGVYGMNPLAARAALKERASAETNLATRISIGEAATDLFFLREAVAKLGIDPDAAAGSCDPNVTTNAARTNIVFRLRSP